MFGEENRGNSPKTSPVPSTDPDVGHWPRLLKQVCGLFWWRHTPWGPWSTGCDGVRLRSLSCRRSCSGLIHSYGRRAQQGCPSQGTEGRVLPEGPSFQREKNQRSWPLSVLKVPCGCFGRVRMVIPEPKGSEAAPLQSLSQDRTRCILPTTPAGGSRGTSLHFHTLMPALKDRHLFNS